MSGSNNSGLPIFLAASALMFAAAMYVGRNAPAQTRSQGGSRAGDDDSSSSSSWEDREEPVQTPSTATTGGTQPETVSGSAPVTGAPTTVPPEVTPPQVTPPEVAPPEAVSGASTTGESGTGVAPAEPSGPTGPTPEQAQAAERTRAMKQQRSKARSEHSEAAADAVVGAATTGVGVVSPPASVLTSVVYTRAKVVKKTIEDPAHVLSHVKDGAVENLKTIGAAVTGLFGTVAQNVDNLRNASSKSEAADKADDDYARTARGLGSPEVDAAIDAHDAVKGRASARREEARREAVFHEPEEAGAALFTAETETAREVNESEHRRDAVIDRVAEDRTSPPPQTAQTATAQTAAVPSDPEADEDAADARFHKYGVLDGM